MGVYGASAIQSASAPILTPRTFLGPYHGWVGQSLYHGRVGQSLYHGWVGQSLRASSSYVNSTRYGAHNAAQTRSCAQSCKLLCTVAQVVVHTHASSRTHSYKRLDTIVLGVVHKHSLVRMQTLHCKAHRTPHAICIACPHPCAHGEPACNWPKDCRPAMLSPSVIHLMLTLLGPWPSHFDAACCWRLLHRLHSQPHAV